MYVLVRNLKDLDLHLALIVESRAIRSGGLLLLCFRIAGSLLDTAVNLPGAPWLRESLAIFLQLHEKLLHNCDWLNSREE